MRLALRFVWLWIALLCLLQIVTVSAQESGYTYTVQPGDSWPLVAQRVGLTVSELQEANPQAVRPSGWLIVGEQLFIPSEPGWKEKFYIVKRGDGWTTVADKFSVSVQLLQAANPKAQRPDESLIVGERLLIPALLPSPTPTIAITGALPPAATPEPGSTPASVAIVTATPFFLAPRISMSLPALVALPPCPDTAANLDQALTNLFNTYTADRYAQVTAYLSDCGAELKILVSADLTSSRLDDAVLVYTITDVAQSDLGIRQKLVILNGGQAHEISYATTAAGTIGLLATQDINADNRTDVVWTDTICGASSCFVTVHVRSWDGSAWRDWTKGTITMAAANVSLTGGSDPAMPREIRLTGGEYTEAGAGPQRERTVVWTSADGALYVSSSESYEPSDCLYHAVIDANWALAADHDLEKAQSLYTDAVGNTKLRACWNRRNELSELRSFALFRLALIAGYADDRELAAAQVQRLESEYRQRIYAEVARRWLDAYQQSGEPQEACGVVRDFAAATQSVVDPLADYGYANPTFTADDVCPILSFAPPPTSNPRLAQIDGLLDCPQTAADYLSALPAVANLASGDAQLIELWLQGCDAVSDDRGELMIYDLNGDGREDLIAMPTIFSAAGYGPGGADGTLIILHKQEDGAYRNAYASNLRGLPKFLALGDANGDSGPELIWQVESCITYCLVSVQAITWDSATAAYRNVIGPAATIAEGTVTVDIADSEQPPTVHRLRLSGGVSGTEAGGLAVPHTEIWYSVSGAPLRRFTWTYDRGNGGSDCLGLRLVEADVALQTADLLGYAAAIELYSAALELSALQPCSIQATAPVEEIALLRGLANFRLVQILALNNDLPAAESLLATVAHSQPQSKYTEAARAWLEAYSVNPDPAAACAAVLSIFFDTPALWQITEEFGQDHPALTAQQVCYLPATE